MKNPEERLEKMVKTRVNERDYDTIQDYCAKSNLTVSAWLRVIIQKEINKEETL